MICYTIWYVYVVLICRLYVKRNLVSNEIGEIFLDDVKIDALKVEGDTSKREMIVLFSCRQIVNATIDYYKCKIKKPMFNCILCQIHLFNTVII